MSNVRQKFFLWAQVLAWYALIFALSAMPNHKNKLPDFETWHGILQFFSRKFAHLTEYGVLMVLLHRALVKTFARLRPFLPAFFLMLALSLLDEWHQTFVFGRGGTIMDVFVDSVGALLGIAFYLQAGSAARRI